MFITVEGIEGVGKSTAIATLVDLLSLQNQELCVTREPGGTGLGNKLRDLLLTKSEVSISMDTELLLMFADRAQHIASVIQPALNRGAWVLCDRFTDASYAYQGGGRGISEQRIAVLEQWVQGDLRPTMTLLLDAPETLALERVKKRSGLDRIEQETLAFFQRVRLTYLNRAAKEPERFYIIDASLSLPEVKAQLKTFVDYLKVR